MAVRSETARLQALADYDVLDSAPEEAFDRLTELAADLFDAPIAVVSLIGLNQQWMKSYRGFDSAVVPYSMTFCSHVVELAAGATMVVEDTTLDPRFADSSPVLEHGVRFYAGAVLTGADGMNLGALCVVDTKPRPTPSARQLRRLEILAQCVVEQLESRRRQRQVEEKERLLDLTERLSNVGQWRFRVADRQNIWSDETYRIHGVSRDSFDPGQGRTLELCHEDDRARLSELVERGVRTGQSFETELRLRRPDGAIRDVICKAESKGASDMAEAVRTAVINKRGGGTGLISGRKAFQRPMSEGVELLNAIQDVYLADEITVA